jgi:hypothetical protein
MRIEINRVQGGRLIIEDVETTVLEFFQDDISSAGENSYDECARQTDPGARYSEADVAPIRIGMRLDRLKSPTWSWLVDESPDGFLVAIDPDWDLVESPEQEWSEALSAMQEALYDFMGAGRGAPVATKFLHYKRRRLFPILDSAVLAMTGLRVPEPTTSEKPETIERNRRSRALAAARCCAQMRSFALANEETLRSLQQQLQVEGLDRTLARILDALIWVSHPASAPSHDGTIRWSHD